jgi:hypothetical protein
MATENKPTRHGLAWSGAGRRAMAKTPIKSKT